MHRISTQACVFFWSNPSVIGIPLPLPPPRFTFSLHLVSMLVGGPETVNLSEVRVSLSLSLLENPSIVHANLKLTFSLSDVLHQESIGISMRPTSLILMVTIIF